MGFSCRWTPARAAAALLALLLATAGCNRIGSQRAAGPDLLLVTLDTVRADHVGAYGATLGATPTLDRLAQEGTRFQWTFATTPLTLPSHASILTGRIPPRHGVRHNGIFRLGPELPTLAEAFAAAGYETGAFVGAVVLAAEFGLDRGFGSYGDAMPNRASAADGGFAERSAGAVTDRAIAWLRRTPGPRLLWVHYYDPHANYRPPEPFARRFAANPYAGEIAYADAQLARLLAAARERAGSRGLITAVTADHGESLGEHGEGTHAFTLYDASLRIPWILHGPGVEAGRRVEELASLTDVAPTLLALAGLPQPVDVDGRDRSRGAASAPDRAIYSETLATRFDFGWAELRSLRTATHRYVAAPRPELYDTRSDPAELHNLLDTDGPPQPQRLRDAEGPTRRARELAERLAALDPNPARASQASALDPQRRRELQALGYVLPATLPQAGDVDPKDGLRTLAVSRFAQANRALEQGDAAGALRDLQEAVGALPGSARVRVALGRALLAQGRVAEALPHFERARELSPTAAADLWIAEACLRLGDAERALLAFESAHRADPANPEALAGLMLRSRGSGNLAAAADFARRALARSPNSVSLRFAVAEHWDRLGDYERALALARSVLEADPEHDAANFLAALQEIRLGQLEAAERHLARTGHYGRDVRSQNRLAIAWAVAGEADRAEAIFRRLIRRHPDERAPRENLERLLRSRGGAP